jgi:hypothetical protein
MLLLIMLLSSVDRWWLEEWRSIRLLTSDINVDHSITFGYKADLCDVISLFFPRPILRNTELRGMQKRPCSFGNHLITRSFVYQQPIWFDSTAPPVLLAAYKLVILVTGVKLIFVNKTSEHVFYLFL